MYSAIGMAESDHQESFGFWLGEHEGAKFWLTVLHDLKARGLEEDIAVVAGFAGGSGGFTDGFSGDYGPELYCASATVFNCRVLPTRNGVP